MNNQENIQEMLLFLKDSRENTNKTLRNAPKGEIHVQNRGDDLSYFNYYKENGRLVRRSIKRDPRLINALLIKDYLKVKRQLLDEDIATLERVAKELHFDLTHESIERLPKRCHSPKPTLFENYETAKLTTPNPTDSRDIHIQQIQTHIKPSEISKWAAAPYRANSSFYEHKIHKASNGLFVRSKSELSLMEWYAKNVRAFHYDELYQLFNQWLSPDFVFAKENGDLIYHEHWGLTTNPDYIKKNINKLYLYSQAGVYPGHNLIITTDKGDGSIDMTLIENILCAYGTRW